ncbi:hypothetical protein M0805_000805 [Coniferiporia weirii]|nr:hypothetical protein M0805_000805 [Coniferiporia weirii]
MSDPVAEKSKFLCMYMSNHPDTLVAYVKYWGKVGEKVVSAGMTSIDTKGMTLSYKLDGKGDEQKQVRVVFNPPLAGYEEVKPRLLAMAADAQESLGMSKSPQITSFELPSGVYTMGLPLFSLLCTFISSSFFTPQNEVAQWLFKIVGGRTVLKVFCLASGVVHIAQAIYVQRLCVKHRTGFSVGFKYVLSTFLFGYTVLVPFRRKIQKARIDSIMKLN